jgi:hypothetical protein
MRIFANDIRPYICTFACSQHIDFTSATISLPSQTNKRSSTQFLIISAIYTFDLILSSFLRAEACNICQFWDMIVEMYVYSLILRLPPDFEESTTCRVACIKATKRVLYDYSMIKGRLLNYKGHSECGA